MASTFPYLMTLDAVKHPETTWVKITTITIHTKFDATFDIHVMKALMAKLGSISLSPHSSSSGQVWTLHPTKFYNQITIASESLGKKKSVKIFSNGSVQIAGCSDLFDCKRVVRQVAHILEILKGSVLVVPLFKVAMINTNFRLNYTINLMEVVRLFGSNKIFSHIEFNPDNYSAVIIKFKPASDMKTVTVSIFSTGSVIITGAETLKEIVFAYSIITKFIELHKVEIKVAPNAVTNTNQFDYICGYHIEELIKHLKQKGTPSWFDAIDNDPVFV